MAEAIQREKIVEIITENVIKVSTLFILSQRSLIELVKSNNVKQLGNRIVETENEISVKAEELQKMHSILSDSFTRETIRMNSREILSAGDKYIMHGHIEAADIIDFGKYEVIAKYETTGEIAGLSKVSNDGYFKLEIKDELINGISDRYIRKRKGTYRVSKPGKDARRELSKKLIVEVSSKDEADNYICNRSVVINKGNIQLMSIKLKS